jgi:carboxynorspermidine decarboxylase
VLDVFERDGVLIAVLDTGVHHLPEVFEYQKRPQLLGESAHSSFRALLVGSSCLPGDVFGEYGFERLPCVGDTLVFSSVGAYSMVKASLFNGHNLPKIFRMTKDGVVQMLKGYDYAAFRSRWSDESF